MAADIERLIAREGVRAGQIAVLVPAISREGQAVAVALEERAVPHRLVGEAAFFQRAEIRDVLAWLRLLADPTDAPAVVRALARPPIELRSVDIARCTQIARRRKLDMVAALAAATESPQVPPEARERIRVLPEAVPRRRRRGSTRTRPDLYVHRLIERLGLRRQQLFAAQADVVERLRALARFGELAAGYARRDAAGDAPRVRALDRGGRRLRAARAGGAGSARAARRVQVLALEAPAALEADHVYVLGLHAGPGGAGAGADPRRAAARAAAADDEDAPARGAAPALYVALTRARRRVVLAYPGAASAGAALAPGADGRDACARAVGGDVGGRARRSCSARPRRSTRPTGCCATSCSRARCGPAAGSASCASTPTSTSRTRSSATSSC